MNRLVIFLLCTLICWLPTAAKNGGGKTGAPAIALQCWHEHGTPNTEFFFIALDRSTGDPLLTGDRIRWDWEGDGTWDTPYGADITAFHAYGVTGTFYPRIQAQGKDGTYSTDRLIIYVHPEDDESAYGFYLKFCQTEGIVGQPFYFYAGPPASSGFLRWDWEDDGIYDTAWLPFSFDGPDYASIQHEFTTPGWRRVRVELQGYGTASFGVMVYPDWPDNGDISDPSETTPIGPIELYADPQYGALYTEFNFTVLDTRTGLPLATGDKVRWDWDGDGKFETHYSTEVTATHRYQTFGHITVRVEVRTKGGDIYTDRQFVNIGTVEDPIRVYLDASPREGTVSTVFHFRCAAIDYGNQAVQEGRVRWDFNDDGIWDTAYLDFDENRGPEAAIDQQFTTPGWRRVRAQVEGYGTASVSVIVSE
ncbi:MAG: hypothetical protein ACYC6A_20390 [Armatimonadota bacterium]